MDSTNFVIVIFATTELPWREHGANLNISSSGALFRSVKCLLRNNVVTEHEDEITTQMFKMLRCALKS